MPCLLGPKDMPPVRDRFFTRCPCCGESFSTDEPGERYCSMCVRGCDVECRSGKGSGGGYILAEGEGKAAAVYSRCEDPLLARAELLLAVDEMRGAGLSKEAVVRGRDIASLDLRRAPVYGFYDTDLTFTIEEFLDAYRQREKFGRLLDKLVWLRKNGWRFKPLPGKQVPMVRQAPKEVVAQAEEVLKEHSGGRKAAIYARDIPGGLPEVKDAYLEDKWRGFDERISHPEIEALFVAFPDVLGDTHVELLLNLSKIAKRGIALYIGKPSPFLKELGSVEGGET